MQAMNNTQATSEGTRGAYFRYIEMFLLFLHLEHPEVWRVMEV